MRESCEICGGESLLALDERREGVDAVACRQCGLVWNKLMSDQQEQLDFYEKDYRQDNQITERYLRSMLSRATGILDFIGADLKPGMKHLDVGCSDGTLLMLTRANGAEVAGLELDEHFRRFAQEKRNITVTAGAIEDATIVSQTYDLVSFSHVVEHLFHPVEQLRAVRQWLRKDGLLFIEVPNIEHPSPGPRSFFCSVHNFYFSPNTLRSLVHRAGFTPLRVGLSPRDKSLQLLVRRREDADDEKADEIPWRDDATRVRQWIKTNRWRYYVTFRFLSRKFAREIAKRRASARFGDLLK